MNLAAFERREEKKRWHIGIENTGSGTEQDTEARVAREGSEGAKVNMREKDNREHHEK